MLVIVFLCRGKDNITYVIRLRMTEFIQKEPYLCVCGPCVCVCVREREMMQTQGGGEGGGEPGASEENLALNERRMKSLNVFHDE